MREFYRAYENSPALLDGAMEIGWTQNVVILETDLTLEEKAWYIRAAHRFGWAKLELTARIADRAHGFVLLDTSEESCYTGSNDISLEENDDKDTVCVSRQEICRNPPRLEPQRIADGHTLDLHQFYTISEQEPDLT